jgi:hydrogenase-4 component E
MLKTNLLAWVSLSIVVCNLYLLGTGRLTAMIRGVAAQGLLLSVLPLLLPDSPGAVHTVILVAMSAAIKGIAIPKFLFRALRGVEATRETNVAVGPSLSVSFGLLVTAFAFYAAHNLNLSSALVSPYHVSSAIATAAIGLFLIVTRRSVVGQVIGYLVFENSAFILGLSIAAFQPLLIELGVLLDMLVGVFIMVIAVHYIHAEHDTIAIESLERLVR